MLSLNQLKDVCLLYSNSSQKCRYLSQDDNDVGKWYCLKKSQRKGEIDDEVKEYLKELKKNGIDPNKQNVPLGDNCGGYPILKYILQGYDQ